METHNGFMGGLNFARIYRLIKTKNTFIPNVLKIMVTIIIVTFRNLLFFYKVKIFVQLISNPW